MFGWVVVKLIWWNKIKTPSFWPGLFTIDCRYLSSWIPWILNYFDVVCHQHFVMLLCIFMKCHYRSIRLDLTFNYMVVRRMWLQRENWPKLRPINQSVKPIQSFWDCLSNADNAIILILNFHQWVWFNITLTEEICILLIVMNQYKHNIMNIYSLSTILLG